MHEIGLYVHIPFCQSKCYYCDFVSFANKESNVEKYVEYLNKEIIYKSTGEYIVKTIYIGGGTPSFINEKYIEKIMKNIRFSYNVDKEAEITIEVNPGTVNFEKLKKYFDIGINRLSIGLQSTKNEILKEIGRIHTYEQYLETIHLAKKAGFRNINSDIIIGLPNQTIEDLEDSIKKLLALDLTHISVYSLIVESGTVLSKKIDNCEIVLPNEDEERRLYWSAKKMLEGSGYIHYEISNFAKRGFESRHNLDCWEQKEYLGFGINASSYLNGIRYSNISNLDEYIKNTKNDEWNKNIIIEERQNFENMMSEYMLLGLRKIKGINIKSFTEKFSQNPLELYSQKLKSLIKNSLIEIDQDYIKLTSKGIDLANLVWEEFI